MGSRGALVVPLSSFDQDGLGQHHWEFLAASGSIGNSLREETEGTRGNLNRLVVLSNVDYLHLMFKFRIWLIYHMKTTHICFHGFSNLI